MSLIEEVRNETKPFHDQLDRHTELSKITSTKASKEDYNAYLQLFQGIHSIVENEIEKHLPSELPFEGRLAFLEKELKLNSIEPIEINSISFSLTPRNVLGAYYVMEGSRLGGKMIARRLRENTQIDYDNYIFLENQPSYSWKSVVNSLDNLSSEYHKETVEGAKVTFKFILSYVHEFYEIKSQKD